MDTDRKKKKKKMRVQKVIREILSFDNLKAKIKYDLLVLSFLVERLRDVYAFVP